MDNAANDAHGFLGLTPTALNVHDAALQEEILLLISQYLEGHNLPQTTRVLEDEMAQADVGRLEREDDSDAVERGILDGDYGLLESLLAKPGLAGAHAQKAFLYAVYRQQFLEFVENRESQKAFNLLAKRLKPLEHYQPVPFDFYNLAYLTCAQTVHDAPSFRDWAGVGPERDRLLETWREIRQGERRGRDATRNKPFVPPDRLTTLLRQAVAYQVQMSGKQTQLPPRVKTLLHDYQVFHIPDRLVRTIKGHRSNVKAISFVGESGERIVSGSSDSTLRIASTSTGENVATLTGHTSRIWDVCADPSGALIASASGDGTVRIWQSGDAACHRVLEGGGGDVYSVRWRPGNNQVGTASYDKILRLWDIETGQTVKTFSGHTQSALACAFSPSGSLLVSGSKDKDIRLWDTVAGVCTQTITSCLGEVSSVEIDASGKYLLTACKDDSHRLWDMRMYRPVYRFTGHENTSKNLIRASFASPSHQLVMSGSEDGMVYVWDTDASPVEKTAAILPSTSIIPPNSLVASPYASSTPSRTSTTTSYLHPYAAPVIAASTPQGAGTHLKPVAVLEGHGEGCVYEAIWSEGAGVMASCGDDGRVGIWGSA